MLDIFNIAASLMALVLGGFAIWLSLYLYTKSMAAETETKTALAAIKAQSDALQKLTARWMDRFTRHATEPRPADEAVMQLVDVVAKLPATVLSQIQQASAGSPNTLALLAELRDCYVGLYYYCCVANVSTQWLLPTEADFDQANAFHVGVASMTDRCAADVLFMESILNRIGPDALQASRLNGLLRESIAQWRPHVRTASQFYAWVQTTSAQGGTPPPQ